MSEQLKAKLQSTTYTVSLRPEAMERLKALCVRGSGPAEWIEKAIESVTPDANTTKIDTASLDEIAKRYGAEPLRTGKDVVGLFERATGLTTRDFVIRLDETESSPIEDLARSRGIPLAECLREHFVYAFAMGWFGQVIYERVIIFTDAEYAKLSAYTGVSGRVPGREVIRLIESLLTDEVTVKR